MYPIHVAADLGKIEILQILIEFGANINQKDSDGQTALHYAASNGYFEAVQYLLSSGIDSNILCNENQTALDLATDIEIIKILKDAA
jgi:ankyrin repeat protein